MNNKLELDRFRIFSGSALKVIALFTMLLDHTTLVILSRIPIFITPFAKIGPFAISLYFILRKIGRIAFPIYAFLITEGFLHTRNKEKYGINLLAFALISEIPWNLEHTGTLFYEKQNVFFTLFLGLVAIYLYEKFKNNKEMLLLSLLAVLAISMLIHSDYGAKGVFFILFIYVMREQKVLQALIGSFFLSSAVMGLVSFIPINMYNGKRGFIKGKVLKYAFYVIYPLHILLLYIIKAKYFGY